jgi:hypothetical protein
MSVALITHSTAKTRKAVGSTSMSLSTFTFEINVDSDMFGITLLNAIINERRSQYEYFTLFMSNS